MDYHPIASSCTKQRNPSKTHTVHEYHAFVEFPFRSIPSFYVGVEHKDCVKYFVGYPHCKNMDCHAFHSLSILLGGIGLPVLISMMAKRSLQILLFASCVLLICIECCAAKQIKVSNSIARNGEVPCYGILYNRIALL